MQFQPVADSFSRRVHAYFFPVLAKTDARLPGRPELTAECRTGNASISFTPSRPPVATKKPFRNGRVYFQNERADHFRIWYSSIFRYRVVKPMPSSPAVLVLLPPVCSSTFSICFFSTRARLRLLAACTSCFCIS